MAMKVRRKRKASSLVIWVVFGLMVLGMSVLISELWQLQVWKKGVLDDQLYDQSVRRVRLPAVRGKIYDTNGEVLADSVPNYCIAIYTEELFAPKSMVAKTLELMHEIWARVGRKPDIGYRDVQRHIRFAADKPLVLYKNLSDAERARWQAAFDRWSEARPIPGLKNHEPFRDNRIAIETSELEKRGTSTAANTLELVYEITQRLDGNTRNLPVGLQKIKNHIYSQKPLPLLAWKNIDEKMMAKWADTCSDLKACDIFYLPARSYSEGEGLAHTLGYTRIADAISAEEQVEGNEFHFDMRGIKGVKGLEAKYNKLLEGEPGAQLVQIDVSGFRHRNLDYKAPKPGGDLQLTIDRNIQRFAWEALTMHLDSDPFEGPVKGAVVVLDPNNGDVLAMVSAPSFDPERYIRDYAYASMINTNAASPSYNRAVFGEYPPGSTFKPIAALGVLAEHPEYAEVVHDCPGYHMLGKRKMRCHKKSGHGEVTLRQTLEHSCNVFMYKMGVEIGYEPIYKMAKAFGLGQPVGLFPDLVEDEAPAGFMQRGNKYGNLPEKAVGQAGVANLSIGQGKLVVAPLQMALVAATIANGGNLYRPRLIEKFRFSPDSPYQTNPNSRIRHIPIPAAALELVRGGMHDVVMGGLESAKCVQVGDVVIAGKTGTAEYGKYPNGNSRKHTWMISFAPFDFPRYAIAFIVEDGVYGGTTVAPRLHELYSKIFRYDGTLKAGEES